MTILEYLQALEPDERTVLVGCSDSALRGLRGCTAGMADTSYLHWACPEYLAAQLGFAFECKRPSSVSVQRCEDCAAAFLSMQMPNTGRRRQ